MSDSRTFHFMGGGRVPESISMAIRNAVVAASGKRLALTLAPEKKYSTDPQRQYYFAVIVQAFQDHFMEQGKWYDKDNLHDSMKAEIGELWEERIDPITGEIKKCLRSYNNLSTVETEAYHTKCRAWAAENGFDIEEPNEHMQKQPAPKEMQY